MTFRENDKPITLVFYLVNFITTILHVSLVKVIHVIQIVNFFKLK